MYNTPAADKMEKAKSKLIILQPFFACLACNLPMSEDASVRTMATNGKWIKYNAEFVDSLSLDECVFVICHEVGHCMLSHMFRRNNRDMKRWNIAGDYIINDLLVKDGIGKMPECALYDPQLVIDGGGTTDGVYNLLPEGADGGYEDGGTGIDVCMDSDGDEAEQAEAEASMKVQVAQAAQAAKVRGKLSSGVARLVEAALKSQVPWEDVTRRFVSTKSKSEYSYARPKRRMMAQNLYLPSLSGEKLGEMALCVDCSGSVDDAALAVFASNAAALKQDCNPSVIHVIYFDSKVCHHDTFGQDDDITITPHGGGGTRFSPVFRHIEDADIDITCCIFLTDLECNDFGPPPSYPVLWVTTGSTQAPWGEVVSMKGGL